MDEIYLVRKYRGSYDQASRTEIASDADTAMKLAESFRDDHHGTSWEMKTGESGDRITFFPNDGNGWVSIDVKPLHGDEYIRKELAAKHIERLKD